MNELEKDRLNEMERLHHRMPRWVPGLLIAGIFIVLAYYTAGLLMLLLISGLIAYLLSSIISRLEYYGIKRSVAVAAVYLAAAFFFICADLLFVPFLQQETINLTEKLPEISRQAEDAFSRVRGYPFAEELIEKLLSAMESPAQALSKSLNLAELFSQAASAAFALVLVPFFVFFILKDWPAILKTVIGWVPAAYVETTVAALFEINILTGNYLRGLAIDCITVGGMASLGLWLVGVSYPVTLGIISGAANVIPYIGPVTACVISCFIAFIQFKSPGVVLNVALLYVMIKLLDDFIVQPLTIGRSVRLHPMLLVISIIAGQKLFGIMGMVLAVPAVTILQKVFMIFMEGRKFSGVRPGNVKRSQRIIV
jgi:predicted PurR-regulated permease PerM